MPGILPEITTGGAVVYRDAAGNPLNPPEVHNAYSPTPIFTIAPCDATALPSNCDARIEAKQINAIVSELLALAECFQPNGLWDCNSLQNLCKAFTAWAAWNLCKTHVGDAPPPTPCPNQLWWESDTGVLWIWYDDGNTTQWVQANPGGASIDPAHIHVGDTPPAVPLKDHLWWESDTGTLYIYYNDGNSTQWVQTSGGGNSTAAVMDQVSIIGAGSPADPHSVGLVDCGSY
jgi:hypothetical protein